MWPCWWENTPYLIPCSHLLPVKPLQSFNLFQEKETRSLFAPWFTQLWALWHAPALVNTQIIPARMNPKTEQLQMASEAQTTSATLIWCSSTGSSQKLLMETKQAPSMHWKHSVQTRFFTSANTSRAIYWIQCGLGPLSNWIPSGNLTRGREHFLRLNSVRTVMIGILALQHQASLNNLTM